jgi:RimJ/RimL family protein N-acetyltransferase
MTELSTPRLRLRHWRESDLPPFAALNADSRVMEFMPGCWRLARESWGQGFATEAARECLCFAFESLALGEVVYFTVPLNRRRHVLYRLRREEWQRAA